MHALALVASATLSSNDTLEHEASMKSSDRYVRQSTRMHLSHPAHGCACCPRMHLDDGAPEDEDASTGPMSNFDTK